MLPTQQPADRGVADAAPVRELALRDTPLAQALVKPRGKAWADLVIVGRSPPISGASNASFASGVCCGGDRRVACGARRRVRSIGSMQAVASNDEELGSRPRPAGSASAARLDRHPADVDVVPCCRRRRGPGRLPVSRNHVDDLVVTVATAWNPASSRAGNNATMARDPDNYSSIARRVTVVGRPCFEVLTRATNSSSRRGCN